MGGFANLVFSYTYLFNTKVLILLTPNDIAYVLSKGTWMYMGEVNTLVRATCEVCFDDLDVEDQELIYEWLMT